MSKKCSDCAAWQHNSYRGWHYCSQGQADICPGNRKACKYFKQASVFQQITASLEVLAKFLVFHNRIYKGRTKYHSAVVGGEFDSYEEAFSATVAKLKEVAE